MKIKTLFLATFALAVFAAPASALQVFGSNYGGTENNIVGFDRVLGTTVPLPGSPWNIRATEDGLYSIALNREGTLGVAGHGFSNDGLDGFRIAGDGAVSAATPTYPGPGGYVTAISPVSGIVYASYQATGIAAARQAADGGLTPLTGSPFGMAQSVEDIAITPDGKFLFATGPDVIHRFAIAADGSLGFIASTALVGAEKIQVTPNGRFALVIGVEGGGDVLHSLAIGGDGSLTSVPPVYEVGDYSTGWFAINQTSTFAVLPNSNLDQIITIAISDNGSLVFSGAKDFEDAQTAVMAPNGDLYIQRTSSDSGLYYATKSPSSPDYSVPVKIADVDWYNDARLAIRAGQGGVAQLKVTAQSKPFTFELDASESAGVSRYSWDLGAYDSTRDGNPTANLKVDKPGTYPVSITAFDAIGCGADLYFTGQSTTCAGNAAAKKTVEIDTPAWITALSLKPRWVGRKTAIKFKLTEKARVEFTVEKSLKGRVVNGSCRKQTRKNKKGKRCTYWQRASKSFRANGKAGRKANSVRFSGKIGKTKLKKGSYRLKAVATDSSKAKGPAKYVKFRVR